MCEAMAYPVGFLHFRSHSPHLNMIISYYMNEIFSCEYLNEKDHVIFDRNRLSITIQQYFELILMTLIKSNQV